MINACSAENLENDLVTFSIKTKKLASLKYTNYYNFQLSSLNQKL
jgi:hypothetical protein